MAMKVLQQETEWNAGYFDCVGFMEAALSDSRALATVFDHTLTEPGATSEQVIKLCEEAVEFHFACIVVNPCWVSLAHSVLAGAGVALGTKVGSSLGAALSSSKRDETARVIRLGAREIEMVLNVGWLRSGMNGHAERDLRGVTQIAHGAGALAKVVLETNILSVEEKLRAAELAISAGADFLRTRSGLSPAKETAAEVALLRGIAGARCGVKASGEIRTLADARAMLEAGANRLGARESVAIVRELRELQESDH